MNNRQLLPAFCLLILVSSCFSKLEGYGAVFSSFMKNDNGQFRGISIGDSRSYITKMEADVPEEIGSKELLYNVNVSDVAFCEIRYVFESNNLYEIKAEFTTDNLQDGLKLQKSFTQYYDETYNANRQEGGFLVWQTAGKTKDSQITIEMTDESSFAEMGSFLITIYDYRLATNSAK
jgi:hypothetical protein